MIKIPDKDTDETFAQNISSFFGENTPFQGTGKINGHPYEERPQQKKMAESIAKSLESGQKLCIEAPTGIGKTFAYLVPAIHWAISQKKPVIVTTQTIALQEQIMDRDLPELKARIQTPFSVALAKGRQNYVCLGRLQNALHHQQEFLPSDDLLPEATRIYNWAKSSKDGDAFRY